MTRNTSGTARRSPVARVVAIALGTAACGGISSGAIAQVARAQNAQPIEEVVVTGSNIRRVNAETAAPIQIVSRDEIERAGKTTIAEYLQTLTADGAGSIPKTFGNGFAMGGAGISLRGLGASSTLVLLNGRRIAPYGLADDGQKVFTDLSVIPMEAVERVEVLKDGASAIYGSDAIAGVVNVILRRNFNGIVGKGSYGISGYSDGNAGKVSLTTGFGNLDANRYNVFFNVEASNTHEIRISDRTDRQWIGSGDLRPYGYSITGSPFLSGYLLPSTKGAGNALSSPAGNVRNPKTLQYASLPGCSQFSDIAPADPNGGCLWQSGKFRYLTPSEKYINVFGRGTFAVTDGVEAYTELGYSKKKTEFQNTPSGVSGAWGFPGGPVNASSGPGAIVLAANHPDNPFGAAARLRYSAWDVGPRFTHNTNDFWRGVVGVKATVSGWDLDTAYLHSETKLLNERDGYLRYSAVKAALGNPTSSLFPWRIGANAKLNSPALYSAISPRIHANANSSLDLIDVKGSRSILELPGGDLGFALGAEYRHLETQLTPQTYTDVGDIIGLGYSAYSGKQSVIGTYIEFLAPVTHMIELSAALRSDHYTGGETSTTPKFGIKFVPWPQLALRATYARGFRAPNAAESGTGGLAAFTTAADPIRCPGGTPIPGATSADCAQSVAIITSPNPSLKPEKSRSVTAGFVFEPRTGTTLSADFWEIKRTSEINQETVGEAIAQGKVVRSDNIIGGVPGTGSLLAALANYINSAATTVNGFDVDARHSIELAGAGRLRFDAQWARIMSYVRTEPDGTRLQYAGTHGNCDVTNCIGMPKDRINFGATWEVGKWNLGTVVNYIGSFDNVAFAGDVCANHFANGSNAPNGCKIASFYTVDLSGHWKPTHLLEVFATINNVLDRNAPLDPLTYGAVDYNPLHSSGAIGRYFTVGMRYSFQ
jgi:iron complex outermembrane recepter protein